MSRVVDPAVTLGMGLLALAASFRAEVGTVSWRCRTLKVPAGEGTFTLTAPPISAWPGAGPAVLTWWLAEEVPLLVVVVAAVGEGDEVEVGLAGGRMDDTAELVWCKPL